MRAIRTTRLGGVLCIGVMVAANLAQPLSASALAGLPLPLLDDLLEPVQSKTAPTQTSTPSTPSTITPQVDKAVDQPPATDSGQPTGDDPTSALKLDKPELVPVAPSPNNLKNPITLSWKAVDGADLYTYEYGTDPNFQATTHQDTDGPQTNVELPSLTDGTYYWRVQAVPPTPSTDLLVSDWSDSSSFVIDTTPPTLTLPAPGSIKDGAQIAFTVTDTNELSDYTVSIADDKGTVVHTDSSIAFPDQSHSYNYAWPSGLPNGEYTLTLTAKDKAGNTSSPVSASLILANDLPQTTATMGPNDQVATNTATLTISGQASANTSTVRITTTEGVEVVDVTPNTDGTWEYTFGNLHAGIYQFNVTAIDAAGNVSAVTQQVQATVVVYTPPVVTVISPDITAPLGRPSAFTPLTTIVPISLNRTSDAATTASIASIAPDVPIDHSFDSANDAKDTSGKVLAASTTGWRIFGIGWQWWAGAVLVGGIGWWLLRGYRFGTVKADDL